MTYADALRPSARGYTLLYDFGCVVGVSLLIALSAQVAIPLPFSPVPVTGQTLTVLLTGALLGRVRGVLSVLAYLAQGIGGLPVFAGGTGGVIHLAGPTGGYLAGFVPAVYLTGLLAERGWDRGAVTAFLAMFLGNAAIYACGLPWLAHFIRGERLLASGLLVFIPGDLLKLGLASALLPSGWKLMRRMGPREL